MNNSSAGFSHTISSSGVDECSMYQRQDTSSDSWIQTPNTSLYLKSGQHYCINKTDCYNIVPTSNPRCHQMLCHFCLSKHYLQVKLYLV